MGGDQSGKARAFKRLHTEPGVFVMPNAWDAGTARLLAAAGFPALGTTSAAANFVAARPDYDYRADREEMLAGYARVAEAVEIPVSGDLENGYGDSPDDVAETIRRSIDLGMVGGSIEDHTGRRDAPLYDVEAACERIRAAREAADASAIPYSLTARAECYLVGHPEPFAESVRRLNRYREAGADCLYAPGLKDRDAIAALVREVGGPVNVVMGLAGAALSVQELEDIGVKRISVGGSLARAALAAVRDAAREITQQGTFTYAERAIPNAELNGFFRDFDPKS